MKFIEYIALSESTKDLVHAIGTGRTSEIINAHKDEHVSKLHDDVFGKHNDHIEIPLKTGVPESVKDHVESQGDKIHPDQDKVILKTGRTAPLSKYLAKSKAPKNVQDEYENHARHKVSDETKLVISRKPAEVASASCGTSWKSCATPDDEGLAWKRMRAEIKHGTMIAMQVHKDAKPNEHGEYDGKDVHGRVLLKRHDSENGHVVFRPESRSYGKFGENAKKAASDFAEKHYPMKDITYMKHESLYDDDKTKFKINPKTS
jgi:hypothetical protein